MFGTNSPIELSLQDFKKAVQAMGNKTPGKSELSACILKQLDDVFLETLTSLANLCIKYGCIPKQWESVIVVLVPKSASATTLDKMRPISLEEVLLKVITSHFTKKIGKTWKAQKVFQNLQYASLPGGSVGDPIYIVKSLYYEAKAERDLKTNRHLHCLFVDLRKAFDTVPHHIVEASLRSLGVPDFILKFFRYMDTHTKLQFKTGQFSHTEGIKPSRGTLQGDPASPLRFNSIMHILMLKLKAENIGWKSLTGDLIFGHCYADDTVLFAESHADLQALANIVSQFCKSLNIGINADKTIYTTTEKNCPDIQIYDWKTKALVPCKFVQPSDPVRYLGTHISLSLETNTIVNKIDSTISALITNIDHSILSYSQALKAANMVIGGYANFHFQHCDISTTQLKNWDNKIYSMLSRKTSCAEPIHHFNHILPRLAGKHRFRPLESLYYQIQISEALIKLCDDDSIINRLIHNQLKQLNVLRGSSACALTKPCSTKVGRSSNLLATVENCLEKIGYSIDTDSMAGQLVSSRPGDKLILDCLNTPKRSMYALHIGTWGRSFISSLVYGDGITFVSNEHARNAGIFVSKKDSPPVWFIAMRLELCIPNSHTLKTEFRISPDLSNHQSLGNCESCLPPEPRTDPYNNCWSSCEPKVNHNKIFIGTGDGSAFKLKGKTPSGFSMKPIQGSRVQSAGRVNGEGGSFKAEMIAQTMFLNSVPSGSRARAISDCSSVIKVFESEEPASTRERIRSEHRTTKNAFRFAKNKRIKDGNPDDDMTWIKAHMKTRIGPVNEVHDLCDNEARSKCNDKHSVMSHFPLHEEKFVLINSKEHLVEGDPRKEIGLHFLEKAFDDAKLLHTSENDDSNINENHNFHLFEFISSEGPLVTNKNAEEIIASHDGPAIRLMIRGRAHSLPTAQARFLQSPERFLDGFCNFCKNNNNSQCLESTEHCLSTCPSHSSRNIETAKAITRVLQEVPDPLGQVWSESWPKISNTQATLDSLWPGCFKLQKTQIYYESRNSDPDIHCKDKSLHPDGTINIEHLKTINVMGKTKCNEAHNDSENYVYTISFCKRKDLPPVKLFRFWILRDKFQSNSAAFPAAIINSVESEFNQAGTRDTGRIICHSNFWAADMMLSAIFALDCGLTAERFASAINFQPLFLRSYSARVKDNTDFGLGYDGLRKHNLANNTSRPRNFLESSYNNVVPNYFSG